MSDAAFVGKTCASCGQFYEEREGEDAGCPHCKRRALSLEQELVRHGLWVLLFVAVTVWELIGVVFPVGTPGWWAHPTISQEVKHLRGNSLAGRSTLTVLLLGVCGTLIWHWGWSG